MPSTFASPHLKYFSKEAAMEQHPTIQDVADQFEQLLIRIMLAVISRLRAEIAVFKSEDEIEF